MRLNFRPRMPRSSLAATASLALLFSVLPCTAALSAAEPLSSYTAPGPSTPSATVSLFAGEQGVLDPDQDLPVNVTVTNTGIVPLVVGSAEIALTSAPFTDSSQIKSWLKPTKPVTGDRVVAHFATPRLLPGSSTTVTTIVPKKKIGISGKSTVVYGVSAQIISGTEKVSGTSTVTWNGGSSRTTTNVAIAMPITAPSTEKGLISSDDLATYTAPDGILTRQVEGVSSHPQTALAIDPMIIASIRVLGSSAPDTATEWLQDLESLSNPIFPLQYADADPSIEVQTGLKKLLKPTSFNYAMDPDDFTDFGSEVGETDTPTPSNTPTATATPKPTPPVRTIQQLLSWPYSMSGIAWPPDGQVNDDDFAVFAQNDLTTTILNSTNTNAAQLKVTPNAAMPVNRGNALVADASISESLRAAAYSLTDEEWSQNMAALNAQLAMISESGAPHTILATLSRSWPASWLTLSRTLHDIDQLPWVHTTSLAAAMASPSTPGLKIHSQPEQAKRVTMVKSLLHREDEIDNFSTLLTTPELLTGVHRNELLSLLGSSWLNPENDWPSAVSASLSASLKVLNSVQILPPGPVLQLSNDVLIPIAVSNTFDLPVNVVLHATPSNGRLEIDSDTKKKAPAKTTTKLLVPVKAKVGNGKVALSLQLYSPTGIPIGAPQSTTIDVHADWEGLGALIIGALVVLLFGFGLVRSIRRRRRERAAAFETSDEEQSEDSNG